MNVLIDLLPDTRQTKLAGQRRRQFFTGISIIVWAVCGGIVLILALYSGSQKFLINNNTHSIADKKTQLQNVPGIIDALTAQQHLASLPSLYSQRTYMTHFLNALTQVSPQDLAVNSLAVDETNTLTISGVAGSFSSVAKLERAMEAENVTLGQTANQSNTPYFTNVTVQSADRSSTSVSFSINATMSSGVTSGN